MNVSHLQCRCGRFGQTRFEARPESGRQCAAGSRARTQRGTDILGRSRSGYFPPRDQLLLAGCARRCGRNVGPCRAYRGKVLVEVVWRRLRSTGLLERGQRDGLRRRSARWEGRPALGGEGELERGRGAVSVEG